MARSSNKSFAKSVSNWIDQTEDDSIQIARDAVKELAAEMIAATPRETGNLANSTHVAANPHDLTKGEPSQKYDDPTAANNAVADAMELGQHLYISQVAPYAASIEFGKATLQGNQPGHFHTTTVAAKWAGIVKRVEQRRKRGA